MTLVIVTRSRRDTGGVISAAGSFSRLQIRASIPHFSRTTLVELRFTRATH